MSEGKKTRTKRFRRHRARRRIRGKIAGSVERPRLTVYKSLRYVYAQLVDDGQGVTLASASSLEPGLRVDGASSSSRKAARAVGSAIAERAQEKGIQKVVFDRGGYVYHGKIKELAEGAREKGLEF